MLQNLIDSGKRLIFVSNSPFWYVDAGMRYVIGDNWMNMWDVTIVSAGKPRFYTEHERPFRQVDQETGRVLFNKVRLIVISCVVVCHHFESFQYFRRVGIFLSNLE